MKSAECNGGFVPAGTRTRDGRLWFPTMRGVSVVDPSRLAFNKLAPPVLVEQVVVNGAALALSAVLLPRLKKKPQRVRGRDVRLFIDGKEIHQMKSIRWEQS